MSRQDQKTACLNLIRLGQILPEHIQDYQILCQNMNHLEQKINHVAKEK